ncbi:MAG TPA: alkyl sulfatase dimerization domain-containing protein [Vicinamibacteria bacterium]
MRYLAKSAPIALALLYMSSRPERVCAQAAKDAESTVKQANAVVRGQLPFGDRQDFEDATRGLIAAVPDLVVKGPGDRDAWSLRDYRFLQRDDPPATVNPSLWRQAQLNALNGLFKVTERVYQVRGFDASNMTLVETRSGLIVIDPLFSVEVARAALDFYYQHRPKNPVVAVIYTHSHGDHYGGVNGVVSDEDVASGRVTVIAPSGFMESAISETVIAGNAMGRRALYQFGLLLPRGERGHVDDGIGKALSRGTRSLIAPTDVIIKNLDRRTIDGVEIVFQLVPGAEAPAEMHLYFPEAKVLDVAETATHTLHNLLPFRGAEVRDAKAWSRYLSDALEQFGDDAQILIAQHQWPTWGNDRLKEVLRKQRDLYKYLHDQTVRLLNQGYTPNEIAEELKLPATLANEWYARDYYGTVSHDVKAIYQKYLGWYDANPAHLNPLPPVDGARKYVDYMGGAAAVIERARDDFRRGNYRWVAEVMNHVVFADPGNREARQLAADAYEQLGYLAESATWRNAYLMAAFELRNGAPKFPPAPFLAPQVLEALSPDMAFESVAVRINGVRAVGKRIVVNWNFSDLGERFVLNLENAALTFVKGKQAKNADATVTLSRPTLDAILLQQRTLGAASQAGEIKVEGNLAKVTELLGLMDEFDSAFEIVEPKRAKN